MNTNTRWGVTALVVIVAASLIFVLFNTSTPAPAPEQPINTDLPQAYSNNALGFSIHLPADYTISEDVSVIKFTIPASVATGTNLSTDTYLSVERLSEDSSCSNASTTGAAAGNRYEETVYALPNTSASRRTCIAIRYFIHYGVIENYPVGTVREFDKQSLLAQFDAIRRTLVVQ